MATTRIPCSTTKVRRIVVAFALARLLSVRRRTTSAGKCVAEVAEGNRKDIRDAVEAAHAAAPGWGKVRPSHRRLVDSRHLSNSIVVSTINSERRTIAHRFAITLPRISWRDSTSLRRASCCRPASLKTGACAHRLCVCVQ
jgi:hypothetical protein